MLFELSDIFYCLQIHYKVPFWCYFWLFFPNFHHVFLITNHLLWGKTYIYFHQNLFYMLSILEQIYLKVYFSESLSPMKYLKLFLTERDSIRYCYSINIYFLLKKISYIGEICVVFFYFISPNFQITNFSTFLFLYTFFDFYIFN